MRKHFLNLELLIPIALGLFSMCYIAGTSFYYLSFTNIDWFISGVSNSDLETHWLGWNFFRNSSFLQFPLLANNSYGEGLNISLVHTDSIPLLGLLFKPFAEVLPNNFQYFGLWILISNILHSIFAFRLTRLYTNDLVICSVVTLFFLFAPIFYMRIFAQPAIGSQWLILGAIFLYSLNKTNYKEWIILLILSVLINVYLFIMIFIFFTIFLLRIYLQKKDTILNLFKVFFSVGTILILTMWLLGYFSVGMGLQEGGFGFYKMNLNSFFDPKALYELHSRIIPDLPSPPVHTHGDYEGFAFPGIGVLISSLIAIFFLFFKNNISVNRSYFLPLIMMSALLFIFAVSNIISFGNTVLFEYPVPFFFEWVADLFRSSARFIWPVYYLIYIGTFYVLIKSISIKKLRYLLIALFLLQIYDTGLATDAIRNRMVNFDNHWERTAKWTNPIKDPVWKSFSIKYKKIKYVLPTNKPKNYFPLALYASNNNMITNFGYFSRRDLEKEKVIKKNLRESILSATYDLDSIYYFEDDELWEAVKRNRKDSDYIKIVDNFRIFAPDYYKN